MTPTRLGTIAALLGALFAADRGEAATLPVEQVNRAAWAPGAVTPGTFSPVVLKAQVLLDRAFFSPGEIDGYWGANVKKALRMFQASRRLPPTGALDQATWLALTRADAAPVLTRYSVTAEDVNGPFTARIPSDVRKAAKLPRLGYTSHVELLAEAFHMSPKLLKRLNPSVDSARAGTRLIVANVAGRKPTRKVASLVVDKASQSVRAYDRENQLVAFYPATVGSGRFPSPAGTLKVTGVAEHPPLLLTSRLQYTRVKKGKPVRVPPGPNNPIGAVWIDLNKHGYGIHGTAEPAKVSKSASHGCVRLTNWDARELSALVAPGVPVTFSPGAQMRAGRTSPRRVSKLTAR